MMRGVPAKWKVKIPVKNAIGRTAKMEMIQINKMIVATYFFYKRAKKKKFWRQVSTAIQKKSNCTLVSSFLAVFRLTIHNLSAAMALAVPDETSRLTPSMTLKKKVQ